MTRRELATNISRYVGEAIQRDLADVLERNLEPGEVELIKLADGLDRIIKDKESKLVEMTVAVTLASEKRPDDPAKFVCAVFLDREVFDVEETG